MSRIIYIDYELQIGGKYLLEYVQPLNIWSTLLIKMYMYTKIVLYGNLIECYF